MFQQNTFNHVAFFKTYNTKFTQENAHDVEDFKALCMEIFKVRMVADLPNKSPYVRAILGEHLKKIIVAQILDSNLSEESKANAVNWFGLNAYVYVEATALPPQQNNTAVEITSCSGMKCVIS